MPKSFKRFLEEKSGATAIEYGLMAALIALALIAGMGQTGNAINDLFGDNTGRLQQALKQTP